MVGWLILLLGLSRGLLSAPFHPISENILEAKQSIYSSRLTKLLKTWPPSQIPAFPPEPNPIWMRGIKTPGNETYVGVVKRMWIHAPLSTVEKLLSDFSKYRERSPNLIDMHIESQDGNKFVTSSEVTPPVFFMASTKFQHVYIIDKSVPKRVMYRYQLKAGNYVNYADCLVVIETSRDGTLLTGIDMYDAKWGPLGQIAASRIWKESLEGYYRGDIALKAKAEHPDWSAEKVTEEGARVLGQFPIEPIQYISGLIPK